MSCVCIFATSPKNSFLAILYRFLKASFQLFDTPTSCQFPRALPDSPSKQEVTSDQTLNNGRRTEGGPALTFPIVLYSMAISRKKKQMKSPQSTAWTKQGSAGGGSTHNQMPVSSNTIFNSKQMRNLSYYAERALTVSLECLNLSSIISGAAICMQGEEDVSIGL